MEYKESGIDWIGKIPAHWETIRFKYVFNIVGGNGFKEIYQGKACGDYPFCKVSDINGADKYLRTAKNYVDEDAVRREHYSVVPSHSILIAKIGEALKKNHRKINLVPCIIDNNLEAFILKREGCVSFFYYVLSVVDMFWFDNRGPIPAVNNAKLKNFRLPLPPLEEQRAIAAFLDARTSNIRRLIELRTREIELLHEYKRALISEAVTQNLLQSPPPPHNKFIKKLTPAHRRAVRLKYVAELSPKVVLPPHTPITFLPMASVKNDRYLDDKIISSDAAGSYTAFADGDLIMAKVTPCFENGNIAIVKNLKNGYGLGSSELYVFRAGSELDTKFLMYFLMTENFKRQAVAHMTGAIGLKRVPLSFIANFKVPLPGLKEQRAVAAFLDRKCRAVDRLIDNCQRQIFLLRELQRATISEAVTGKTPSIATGG